MAVKKPVIGTLSLTAKGFGFVQVDGMPDVFIDLDHLNTGMDGDLVEIEVFGSSRRNRPAGRVRRVTERSGRKIIGVFRETPDGGKLYPEDNRVPSSLVISSDQLSTGPFAGKIRTGTVVAAVLDRWDNPKAKPVARISDVIGDQGDPGMDLKVIALVRGLALTFPDNIEAAAREIRNPNMRKEARNRLDLRKLDCVTIDPESARDFDDALSVEQLTDGLFEVGIHIADVSHFVPEDSEIDKEAYRRGTSVYFVQTALPMLPERLSSDLCSLMPGQDRLAFSVLVKLDSLGTIHDYRITPSIIRSKHRFTYREAQAVLAGATHQFGRMLHLLELLANVLGRLREQMGSIDFDVPERAIVLDKDGVPLSVNTVEQIESQRLVAEFMLLANRIVAGHAVQLGKQRGTALPFVYRVHERPAAEDVEQMVHNLHELGLPYKVEQTVTPDDYRNILRMIENFEFKDFVERVAFSSMTKAEYRRVNEGHFGLAFDAYTHFTSPIRRYADLVVHRLLRGYLAAGQSPESGGVRKQNGKMLSAYLDDVCIRCSDAEKVATGAEREYSKLKSLECLQRKLGKIYEGIISGVTSFGLFVELSRYLIEGLVKITELPDDTYRYDGPNFRCVGEKSGKVYRLGDRVTVRIERVSVADRKADFALVDPSRSADVRVSRRKRTGRAKA